MNYRIINIVVLALLTALEVHGQKGYEFGGWLGAAQYYGDLNSTLIPKRPRMAGGLLTRYNFNNRISARVGMNIARISGADRQSTNNFEQNRNLSFRSNIFEGAFGMEFNFFEYIHGSKDYFFTPYFLAGFSIFSYNPKAEIDGRWHALRPLGTEGQDVGDEYSILSSNIFYGFGFKWDYNRDISFNVEFSSRKLFTDYLDDVSTTYPDLRSLSSRRGSIAAKLSDRSINGDLSVSGRQRGNRRSSDNYVFLGIGVMRYFGGIECPKISRVKF